MMEKLGVYGGVVSPEHILHLGHVSHDVLDEDEGHRVVHAALPLAPQHLLVPRVPLVQHHLGEGVSWGRRSRWSRWSRRSRKSRSRRNRRSRCKLYFQRFPRKPV